MKGARYIGQVVTRDFPAINAGHLSATSASGIDSLLRRRRFTADATSKRPPKSDCGTAGDQQQRETGEVPEEVCETGISNERRVVVFGEDARSQRNERARHSGRPTNDAARIRPQCRPVLPEESDHRTLGSRAIETGDAPARRRQYRLRRRASRWGSG